MAFLRKIHYLAPKREPVQVIVTVCKPSRQGTHRGNRVRCNSKFAKAGRENVSGLRF